jgi:predicted AlkP superfamily pyrophosphatase or phosphodiesterase
MVRAPGASCIPSRRRGGRGWLRAGVGFLAWAAALPALAAPGAAPAVVLISFDGTPAEAVRQPDLPAFAEVARRGAAATRLVPVFPTNTFPNHVTLVTGVAPAVHGIVGNVFLDPERGEFRYSGDPSWIEAEPIWSIAARHSVVSAAFHWVGSEGPWRNGRGPRYWKPFDPDVPERDKVDQILAWLDLPDAGERPRLVTSWFRGVDRAGHDHGPDSRAVRRGLRQQDRALGRLLRGLDERAALTHTTLLLVSDHGMLAVERHVDLPAALDRRGVDARVLGAGGFAIVSVRGGARDADRAVAVARDLGLEAWTREEAPPGLRLDHPRFGPVVALAPPGTAIQSSHLLRRGMRGSHGYRPEAPGMSGMFLAVGRGARPGASLGEVRAVDVAPTVLALLGIPVPDRMEGAPLPGLRPPGREAGGGTTTGGGTR